MVPAANTTEYIQLASSYAVEPSLGRSPGTQAVWQLVALVVTIGMAVASGCITGNCHHYSDVIMSAMASQITSVSMVCSAVWSSADQRKHQSSASLAFVRGIQQWLVDFPHKGPVTRKIFPFDDVITIHLILKDNSGFNNKIVERRWRVAFLKSHIQLEGLLSRSS